MNTTKGLKIFHKTYESTYESKYSKNVNSSEKEIVKEAQDFIDGCTEIISHKTSIAGGGEYSCFYTTLSIIGK